MEGRKNGEERKCRREKDGDERSQIRLLHLYVDIYSECIKIRLQYAHVQFKIMVNYNKAQAHVNDSENMERNAHLHTYEMFRVAIFLVAHFLTVLRLLLLLLLLLHVPFVTQDFFICLWAVALFALASFRFFSYSNVPSTRCCVHPHFHSVS